MIRFILSGLLLVAMPSLLWFFYSQREVPSAVGASLDQIDLRFCWHLSDEREQQLRCLRNAAGSLEGADLISSLEAQISILFQLDRSNDARPIVEAVLADQSLFQNADQDMVDPLANIVLYGTALAVENEAPDLVLWESIVSASQQLAENNNLRGLLHDLAYQSLLLDRIGEVEGLLNLAEAGEQAEFPLSNEHLRGRIARARSEWPEVETIYQEIAQRQWSRDSSGGVGEPPLSRILIMQELEGVDYEHGEPSFPLTFWSEARFFWLEAREAQGNCQGWQHAVEELEVALSYHLEEIRDVLRWTEEMDRQIGEDQPGEHSLMYRRDLAQGLLRRAAIRGRLGLRYFSDQDQHSAEQLIDEMTPASLRAIEAPREPAHCIQTDN